MAKWNIIILLLMVIPLVSSTVTLQYLGEDNTTWYNLTGTDENKKEGYQIALDQDTLYYLRGKNDNGTYTDTWTYTEQRTKEGLDNMWMLAVLLIPLGLCFFFVYLAHTMDDAHNPLKWFFRLISLALIFVVYQGAHTIIALNSDYADLAQMFNIGVYGWIFWVIMAYVLIYLLYQIFMSFKHNKEWNFDEDWMK